MFDVATLIASILMSLACHHRLNGCPWLRISTIVSMILPIILVSMGSAAGIHILNRFHEDTAKADPGRRNRAGDTGINRSGIYDSLTTAVGFASFATSFISPVRTFGIFAAAGIMTQLADYLDVRSGLADSGKSTMKADALITTAFPSSEANRKSFLSSLLESAAPLY